MIQIASLISLVTLFLCLALAMVRVVVGPTAADRALAADAVILDLVAIVAVYSIYLGTADYVDLVLVFSLLGFVGTVAFSKYLGHGRVLE